MKKLSKLFLSIFASAILSVTSASAIISIPDAEALQNKDVMCDLVLDISKEYIEHKENHESLKELRKQIIEICTLKFKCEVGVIARFLGMLNAALEGKTERSYLKSLEKINCNKFLILNRFKDEKFHFMLYQSLSSPPVLDLAI